MLPIVLGCVLVAIEWHWFSSLYQEAGALGHVYNNIGWFAYFYLPFRPLWLEHIFPGLTPFHQLSETITSVGWFLVIPLLVTLNILRKRSKGPGLGVILPFFIFLTLAYLWESRILSIKTIQILQAVVPFLEFFRVATRWSLLVPATIGVIIALAWPEVSQKVKAWYLSKKRNRILAALFALSSLCELTWLLFPVKHDAADSSST